MMGLFDWLFKKSEGSQAGPAPATGKTKWKVGDRVLAQWQDSQYYPGQIRNIAGQVFEIAFDDGDVGWVRPDQIQPGGQPAGPAKPTIDLGEPLRDSNWLQGDRVLARWLDFFWYPGTILGLGTKGYHILYDDGDQRVVQEAMLMPLAVEEGEAIYIRPKNEPQRVYTPATVVRAHGETIDVDFEDGHRETNTKVSRARFWRCPKRIGSLPFDEGDRVLAFDADECVYPAEIVSIQEDRVIVQYLDGPERPLTPELIRKFDLRPGLRIEGRFRGGPNFFPGKIGKLEGERLFLEYDDGDKEWTSVRLIRLPKTI